MTIAREFQAYIEEQLGAQKSVQVLQSLATPLRAALRLNTLKANAHSMNELLNEIATQHSPIPWWQHAHWWHSKYPEDEFKIGWTVEHQAGALYVQEASSMLPVAALAYAFQTRANNTTKPAYVLDMCAAPGSKTTQLADWMGNQGLIVANELSSSRLKSLAASLQRCGVSNTVLSHQDARQFGAQTPQFFDAILLDAPCTGEGTHRKDPNALREWNLQNIQQTACLQKELVESAYQALAPGGVLIYSTCTLNHFENHDVCKHLLAQHGDQMETIALNTLFPGAENACTDEGWLWLLPQIFDCEGFFVAAFRKKGSHSDRAITRTLTPPNKAVIDELQNLTQQCFGVVLDKSFTEQHIWQKDTSLMYSPEGFTPLPSALRLNRQGVLIAEQKGKTWRLQHESIATFIAQESVSLTRAQARDYLMGRDLNDVTQIIERTTADVVVSFAGIPLGLAGNIKGKLKNRYPREFVSDKLI